MSDSAMLTGLTAAVARELIDANLACQQNPGQCVAAVLPVPTYQERPEYTPIRWFRSTPSPSSFHVTR